ncbi:MAG: hypothetical protein J6P05_06260 [Lachnospiraceae bacterium]|nr:hypothetical protein [Lachnospiraceae bacterium]
MGTENTEKLDFIMERQKKQFFWLKVVAIINIIGVTAIIFVLLITVPKAMRIIKNADSIMSTAEEAKELVERVNGTLSTVTDAVGTVQETSEKISVLIDNNSESLSVVVEKIDELKKLLDKIQSAIEPAKGILNGLHW